MNFLLLRPDEIDRRRYPLTAVAWRTPGGRWLAHLNPTIWGAMRLNVGPADDPDCYELDYCCGPDRLACGAITAVVFEALADVPEEAGIADVGRRMPVQRVKPMHNDPECWARLCELAGVQVFELPGAVAATERAEHG